MPIFVNKTQTLSFQHIVCVGLVLYLELFGYKFSLSDGVVLMLDLIIIIVIKEKSNPQIQLDPQGLSWIFFNPP